jgi:RAB protein geranylgeranyltransferase component A
VVPRFCQKYGSWVNFAEHMELCQGLPKIWKYVKFCQTYGVVPRFCQKYGRLLSFAKNMELCQGFAKNMDVC